jgi:putative iron-only hydrogenase system regulator
MKRVAVISAILESPKDSQHQFNDVVSNFKGIIKGRMGIPLDNEGVAVICIVVIGEVNEINSLTGKLGNIKSVVVKTSISKVEV